MVLIEAASSRAHIITVDGYAADALQHIGVPRRAIHQCYPTADDIQTEVENADIVSSAQYIHGMTVAPRGHPLTRVFRETLQRRFPEAQLFMDVPNCTARQIANHAALFEIHHQQAHHVAHPLPSEDHITTPSAHEYELMTMLLSTEVPAIYYSPCANVSEHPIYTIVVLPDGPAFQFDHTTPQHNMARSWTRLWFDLLHVVPSLHVVSDDATTLVLPWHVHCPITWVEADAHNITICSQEYGSRSPTTTECLPISNISQCNVSTTNTK
jgi:hypothetical protein